MNKYLWWTGITLVSLGLISIIIFMIYGIYNDNKPVTYEKVKCYDRWNNEIIGEICLSKVNNLSLGVFVWLFLTIITIGGGLHLIARS